MTTRSRYTAALVVLLAGIGAAQATEHRVGPGRPRATLGALFANVAIAPGDVVRVDAATYGSVVVPDDVVGTAAQPITIIGEPGPGGARPILQGGTNTIAFFSSHHVVLQGFEIRGGSARCVFLQAHDITLRDVIVHDCPNHGIHGADDLSGSFTLEYSEVYDAGSGQTKHPLYMQCDEHAFPDAVFRMRHSVVRDGNGGNLLKSRFARNEIHYNWFEGSAYQEIELIGPDWLTQHEDWEDDDVREDSDLVGNVIVHTGTWNTAIRAGGDLNGRSAGRVRLVNNTIVFDTPSTNMRAVVVQLGLESLEMHNNVIFQVGSARAATLVENVADDVPPWGSTAPWVAGRRVFGSRNWTESGASGTPAEWTETRTGTDPGFASVAMRDFHLVAGAALRDAGGNAPTWPAYPFPDPLALPLREPSAARIAPGAAPVRSDDGATDIGAFAFATGDVVLRDGFESP